MERTLATPTSLITNGELELHKPNSSSPLVITSSHIQWNLTLSSTPTYVVVIYIMNILLSLLPLHHKCQCIFYKNDHNELVSKKSLKHVTQSQQQSTKHWCSLNKQFFHDKIFPDIFPTAVKLHKNFRFID